VIRALVLDVDGVLTDGGVILDEHGREAKRFHSQDGVGIRLALLAGWRVLFLTARESQPARRRAEELGAEWAIGIARKDTFLERWLRDAGIDWQQTAYMGDDLQDLRVMRRVGWPVAVKEAAPEVKEVARFVTRRGGGAGAVREAVEWLLESEGVRERTIESFVERTGGFAVGEGEESSGHG
jgi:YrbI family 3-deoxy-D-manno-octulosonate 8-phosphate phosphatase